jgi:hypothetical protein
MTFGDWYSTYLAVVGHLLCVNKFSFCILHMYLCRENCVNKGYFCIYFNGVPHNSRLLRPRHFSAQKITICRNFFCKIYGEHFCKSLSAKHGDENKKNSESLKYWHYLFSEANFFSRHTEKSGKKFCVSSNHRNLCTRTRVCLRWSRDRCYDFLNIFAEKFSANIGVFCLNYC